MLEPLTGYLNFLNYAFTGCIPSPSDLRVRENFRNRLDQALDSDDFLSFPHRKSFTCWKPHSSENDCVSVSVHDVLHVIHAVFQANFTRPARS